MSKYNNSNDLELMRAIRHWIEASENPKDFWLYALGVDLKGGCGIDEVHGMVKLLREFHCQSGSCESCPLKVGPKFPPVKSWDGEDGRVRPDGRVYPLSDCIADWSDDRWRYGKHKKKWKQHCLSQLPGTEGY